MSQLERYEIVRELGRGAMGVVWLARDKQEDRDVALKELLVPPGVSGKKRQELEERFEREAQAAASLDHDGIVRVYDSFVEDDRHFIVMEYLAGERLDTVIKRGPLPVDAAIGVVAQVLTAVEAAHAAGIVHRDLKPENVFVLEDGTVKVTDFGVARMQDSAGLTMAGQVLGTIAYMAPEQVRGVEVDARADVFAMGVMLHELLIGSNPFLAEQPTTTMYRISYEDAPALDPFIPGMPAYITPIIRKATAKEAELRYQSAAEMLSDLESGNAPDLAAITAASAARVAPSTEATVAPAARKPLNRRLIAAVALLVVVLLVGGGAAFAYMRKQAAIETQRKEAILAEGREMAKRVARLKAIRFELNDCLHAARVKSDANARALKAWDKEWAQRKKKYNDRVADVRRHNSSETDKELGSYTSTGYYDWWGNWVSTGGSYEYSANYWDMPKKPKKPKKVSADLSAEQSRLADIETQVNVLGSEIASATPNSRFWGSVYLKLGEATAALANQITQSKSLLSSAVTKESRGDKIVATKVWSVDAASMDAPLYAVDQSVAEALSRLGVKLEEILPPSTESSSTAQSQ